jgi:glycosyltransferase involved in cell wall biosynthesis
VKFILRLGEAMGVRFANRLIVISKTIQRLVIKKHHRKDSVIIFNGVNLPPDDPVDEIAATLLKYGLDKRKYVLAVGRLVPEKGFHDLLEALGGRDDLTVVIAGASNPSTAYSEALVKRAQDYGCVMTGFVTGASLRHLFWGASLFVLPSTHEGLPIALLEAMSFGKNVLVSDIPANLDVRLPKDCYFKVGNVDDLRRCAMEKLKISKPNSFSQTLKRQYNWNVIAKKTSKIYHELIKI